jgi:cold-inducible RNA-binding protein
LPKACGPPRAGSGRKTLKIYVDNLSYSVSEEFVRKLFSRHGDVRDIWITKTRVGVPHGYGFVHMPDTTAAETAIAKLDGLEFDGRAITVNKARR